MLSAGVDGEAAAAGAPNAGALLEDPVDGLNENDGAPELADEPKGAAAPLLENADEPEPNALVPNG